MHQAKNMLMRSMASKPKFRPKKTSTAAAAVGRNGLQYSETEVLYGFYPVLMALNAGARDITKIYYNESSSRIQSIVKTAQDKGVPVQPTDSKRLDALSQESTKDAGVHQGVCARVSRLDIQTITQPFTDLGDLSFKNDGSKPLWVLLASISDPQNLGAVLRSAYYLGARGVMTCDADFGEDSSAKVVRKRTARLSPVASKASAGVLEIFRPVHVPDPEALLRLKKAQGWNLIGSFNDQSESKSQSEDIRDGRKQPQNSILILGNEGYGMPESLKQYCNRSVHLKPGRILDSNVDSLNVSVASALLIQSLNI